MFSFRKWNGVVLVRTRVFLELGLAHVKARWIILNAWGGQALSKKCFSILSV